MKQLNESFQSQEIKDIIQNNEFFKYYIPEPFFTTPTLSNLAIFGEKHSNMLYYNIHYTIVKLYHTYLKLFNEETQDKFINTDMILLHISLKYFSYSILDNIIKNRILIQMKQIELKYIEILIYM